MESQGAQRADDVFDFILLEEADGGDSGGAGLQTGCGVAERHAAERKHGDFRGAGVAQGSEAGWGCAFLFEYGSEDGEVGVFGFGANDVGFDMARNGDKRAAICGMRSASERLSPDGPGERDGNVIATQVDAIGAHGEGDVGARVD